MFKQALALWKKERGKKGSTLHRRLLMFFISTSVSLVLVFAILLSLFGITGKEAQAVEKHIDTELTFISNQINDDFGRLSVGGVTIAKVLSETSDEFFQRNDITASSLSAHPELLEGLLSEYMSTLVSTINNRYCGGVFVMLDATVKPDAQNADMRKAGVFIKKTQPTATDALGVKLHYLRGPASLAREYDIMLLGQWQMEYDISDEEFFTKTVTTARENPDRDLNRLYYWTGRTMLKGNSEAGFLLCVPLRADDGTVFGICGIEVSDRLFKSLYTPTGGNYENIFTVMSPRSENGLLTSEGMVAGNSFLTGKHWQNDLVDANGHEDFHHYSGGTEAYGGKCAELHLYPEQSPYASEEWCAAILMPQDILHSAVKGNSSYFYIIMVALLILSIAASAIISRFYLSPVNKALDKIKNQTYTDGGNTEVYSEIGDLIDFLAQKDRDHDEALRQKDEHVERLQGEHEKARREIDRLSYSRKNEVDPDNYLMFVQSVKQLTPVEKIVFNYYLEGKTGKEIIEIMGIKESTLKFHNGNIYGKLGVTSRKELLLYAAMMKNEGGNA